MKISYNWLKWYVPEVPDAEKLADLFTYHVCEVESVEKREDGDKSDWVFDIKVLPNRAHDLLSHHGIAREIASLLNIEFKDPKPFYKVPESVPTTLIQEINTPNCLRYMGRVVRNIKVGPSPEWVVKHLESIGQRSINNIVDATNITMFDCGQPTHVFDLAKIPGLKLQVRNSAPEEKITLLSGGEKTLNEHMMIIADDKGNALDIAGIKGGKYAELTDDTTDIILEAANFDPTSVRKTAQALGIFTEARKRFENDLSPELAAFGMLELSALIKEMCPNAIFEEIVDVYPEKPNQRKLSFTLGKVSKILGLEVSKSEVEDILTRYHFTYIETAQNFEIEVPAMRLDLTREEDMAEEIGRVLGYDRLEPSIPKINFNQQVNETHAKISWARHQLLEEGYSEVVTYVFADKGEIEVLESASDKKFLRTNLTDGLKESIKLNQINLSLLGMKEIKIFEIGTVLKKSGEEIRVAYGDKKGVKEVSLEEFCESASLETFTQVPNFTQVQPDHSQKQAGEATQKFIMWSLFPFIARDVAVWVPEGIESSQVAKVIKENAGELVVRGPELFDEFKKEGKVSYAFRLVFQSFDRTLTDQEVNDNMERINKNIVEKGWQVR